MSQFNIKALVYFFLLAALVGLGDCWSTIITEKCVTKSQKNPGTTPMTVTVTRTRYVQEISTLAITPTDVVAYSTTTKTESLTAVITTYTATTTVYTVYQYSDYDYTRLIVNTTSTDVVVVTVGKTTKTVPLPSGFTPAAANPTTTGAPPIRVAFEADADVGRVVCTEKHILSTTVTTTVTAAVVTVTESTAVQTNTISDITTTILTTASLETDYSYGYIATSTTTYTTITRYIGTTTSTSINVPTATAYPACAANNLLSSVGGHRIGGFTANSVPLEVNMTDPYSCCVACQKTDRCTGSVFYIHNETDYYTDLDANCFLFTVEIGHKCRPAKKAGWGYYLNYYDSYEADTWIVSNGQCGQGYLTSNY